MKYTQPRYAQDNIDKLSQTSSVQEDHFQSWLDQMEGEDDFLLGKVSDFVPDLSEEEE